MFLPFHDIWGHTKPKNGHDHGQNEDSVQTDFGIILYQLPNKANTTV